MADSVQNNVNDNVNDNLIDPIYEKFSRSVRRALASTDFYEFFMDTIQRARNEFQFSNRKMEKLVDLAWVDAIEDTLDAFQNIVSNPRNIIREEEIIVNVANARKGGPDVVRHLAQHGAMVEDFNEETGEVRPSRLMQKIRDDSEDLYENRLAFTVLERAAHFVSIRHNALLDAMGEEFGAKLKVTSNLESVKELVHVDMFVHIKDRDDAMETDEKNSEVFARIARIDRLLMSFMNTQFAVQMRALNRVKGNITKTNVLKRNPDYRKVVALWEFLRKYDEVGYFIKVTEQNPVVNERLEQDIYHTIMFQYLMLKSYLENAEDREIPEALKTRRRKLKPKVIKQIIEELTEDYDLPDIEVRKVLIEELTKEQLMLEEEAERRRLVEEQEARRREEEERLRLEEEARLQAEQEEEARLLAERKAIEEQERILQLEREIEERRRAALFRREIEWFHAHKLEWMELRSEREEFWNSLSPVEDFADAALQLELEEQRKWEEEERIRIRREEEEARRIRLAEEAEKERIRTEQAEKERIRREQEEAQRAIDRERLSAYIAELSRFDEELVDRRKLREESDLAFRLQFIEVR